MVLQGSLPSWLVAGVGLGLAASAVIAVVSAVGTPLAPDRPARSRGTRDSRRRRREIHEFLRRIDEPFVEDPAVAGHEVAFYIPDRDVAVAFGAPTSLALRDHPIHLVLVEHGLPGAILGQRLPDDVPVPEYRSADSGSVDDVAAAFDRLGLARDADVDAVVAASRECVKVVNPHQGGDSESFRAVQETYATARDHAAESRTHRTATPPATRHDTSHATDWWPNCGVPAGIWVTVANSRA